MPIIPAFQRMRQEGNEFEAILVYIGREVGREEVKEGWKERG
jgi:hypothetical protein